MGMKLEHFIPRDELRTIRSNCRGEEGQYFKDMIKRIQEQIDTMPKTGETDGKPAEEVLAVLHYFYGGSDWYIVEADKGAPDDPIPGQQIQAFGFTCLNGDKQCAELGYVSIQELIEIGVELDLYYKPEPLSVVIERFKG